MDIDTNWKCAEPLLIAKNISKVFQSSRPPGHVFIDRIFGLRTPHEEFVALKPVSLSVYRGTSVGIMGRNGAGKSTLLSILAGITCPTTGSVVANGRVAALIGVGQSFNGEETGRYNALRFCRLLGLNQKESDTAVEKIRQFSELDEHFDRKVKTYSTGMRARLNFSCATFVKADVIIVDEVLAVGDAEFRSKCYAHIESNVDNGQTYIMVSQSPTVVANYCDRAIVLESGVLVYDGDPLGGMKAYQGMLRVGPTRKKTLGELKKIRTDYYGSRASDVGRIEFLNVEKVHLNVPSSSIVNEFDKEEGRSCQISSGSQPAELKIVLNVLKEIYRPRIAVAWRNAKGISVAAMATRLKIQQWTAGTTWHLIFRFIPKLVVGVYTLRLEVSEITEGVKDIVYEREGLYELQVVEGHRAGIVDLEFSFTLETSALESENESCQERKYIEEIR